MTRRLQIGAGAAALAAGLALASCGADAPAAIDPPTGEATTATVDGILAIEDDDSGVLGSIELPRPDWLPSDMPLPGDAHIYITTRIPRGGDPDLFMLQAKSKVDSEAYAKAFFDWAQAKGLKPEMDDKPGRTTRLVGFTGAGDSPAMLQVISREGYRDIVISFAGPL
ncbi:MAG: hypothetical protein GC147_06170 [Porphyrobacter sp.]|nr:hypothetical protein [Porphyrobacter sp.]